MIRQADRRKYHYVYRITRKSDDKYYIGIHSTDDLDDGYFGSGKRIRRSIIKYGKEAHTKEILEFHSDRETIKKREAELVNEECIADPLCLNLCLGGNVRLHHIHTEDTKIKIGNANKGIKFTDERKRKISEALKGKSLSDSHRAKIKENRQHQVFTEETRKKLSELGKGRIRTEESKQKTSDSLRASEKLKAFHKTRGPGSMSEEQKRKISESRRKNPRSINKNSTTANHQA